VRAPEYHPRTQLVRQWYEQPITSSHVEDSGAARTLPIRIGAHRTAFSAHGCEETVERVILRTADSATSSTAAPNSAADTTLFSEPVGAARMVGPISRKLIKQKARRLQQMCLPDRFVSTTAKPCTNSHPVCDAGEGTGSDYRVSALNEHPAHGARLTDLVFALR